MVKRYSRKHKKRIRVLVLKKLGEVGYYQGRSAGKSFWGSHLMTEMLLCAISTKHCMDFYTKHRKTLFV
jgi:RimJ/RimL family protein N-acetyltransferase